VLLGSGVSSPSRLPMARGLMDRILKDPYHLDEKGRFRPGAAAGGEEGGAGHIARIRQLIRLLAGLDEVDRIRIGLARVAGCYVNSGAIYRTATTYEDVFALCQQIDDWFHGLSDSASATQLVELVEREAGTIVEDGDSRGRIIAIGQLVRPAMLFIQAVVADALSGAEPAGLGLLLELVAEPDIAQINIVTLNHDTLVEQLLARAGIPVVDGFGAPDGDIRWYDDAQYDDADARVKLIKLHGSINWYTFDRDRRESPAILIRGEADTASDGAGKAVPRWFLTPAFLTGGEKEAWYQHGIFADLHFRFHGVLRQCDRMIVSGYGWGDTGITNQLDRWFDQRPGNRLILLHERPEEIVERSPIVHGSYADLVQRRKLIPIRSWLCNASLAAIRPVLSES
jgi:hypothetical protein